MIEDSMKWWEIKTNGNRRPNSPEDNIIIIKAFTMSGALDKFIKHRGELTLTGEPVLCKQIHYVKEWDR